MADAAGLGAWFLSCVKLLSGYNASRTTPATHLEEFMQLHDNKAVASVPEAVAFHRDVFLGVERYSKLIRVVCDALYSRHTGEILRTDRQLYNALIYIVGVKMPLVELKQQQPSDLKEDNEEEHSGLTARSKTACPGPQLGVEQLSYWALAQRADFQLKVQRLIEFLYVEGLAEPDLPSTNQDALKVAVDAGVAAAPPAQTLIRRWWCELYDPEYVDHKIIAGMKRCQPAIMKLLHDIEVQRGAGEAKQANKTAAVVSKRRRSSKQKTVPKPFNLTTPKPRVIPYPTVEIKATPVCKEVPKTLYKTSLEKINREKEHRREDTLREVMKKHQQASAPSLNTDLRPMKLEAAKRKREIELKQLHQSFKAKPAPDMSGVPATQVRMTTAAVLREEVRFRKRQEEQAKMLRAYEYELKDSTEFEQWQEQKLREDEERREREIQARKEALEKSCQKASEAVQKRIEEAQTDAKAARETLRARKQQLQEEEERMLEQKRAAAEQLSFELVKQVAEAKAKLAQSKRELTQQTITERKLLKQRRERAEQQEMVKRREVIRQIQAMEQIANARAKRPREFDPTESSNQGLLNEMSLVELHERLNLMRLREREEIEDRKSRISTMRQEREERIAAKRRNIARLRSLKADDGNARRSKQRTDQEQAKTLQEQRAAEVKQQVQQRLNQRKQDKRAAALRLAREVKEKKRQLAMLARKKSQVDALRERSMAAGQKRREARQQKQDLLLAKRAERLKKHHKAVLLQNARAERQAREHFREDYKRRMEGIKREVQEFEDEEAKLKQAQVRDIKEHREQAIAKDKTRNPYATSMERRSAARARAFARARTKPEENG